MGLSVACVLGGTHGEHLCAFALWLSTEVLLQVASIAESSFLLLDSGWHCILQRTINYKASPAREGAVNILQKQLSWSTHTGAVIIGMTCFLSE